ncbi:hypothetical protein SAMN04487928_10278 [Butyrivibrio proteoclasticus]|uniref:MORN repeat-containing protein n=1 Tax=Butyrivibrio proteoclasticus TaxID=43305 RepID=A0A1I5QEI3_9FIRM|nr:hypothetical protein [Butyrivibrio proteoclasticus]SFP44557.1 hypothetical protein SAMN04487928_10278 [Butyrivibrio proteoclasticus]
MDKNEKIKVAITSGIVAAILLILVLFLALSGKKENDEKLLDKNISEYASLESSLNQNGDSGILISSESADSGASQNAEDNAGTAGSSEDSDMQANSIESVNDISGNSLYSTKAAVLKNIYKGLAIDTNAQLKEMYTYWSDNNTEAVRDLAHLERFEAMSYKLSGTQDFYYYGDLDSTGLPEGTGLAVYGDDQYYFGEWKVGKRNGNGTWINFYPDYSNYVVTEHMYTGAWSDDLPTGEGQEHYDYDFTKMNGDDIYVQNAIGSFENSYYNGKMYIITIDKDQNTEEWFGTCQGGTWQQVVNTHLDKDGKIPVLQNKNDEKDFVSMTEEGTKDNRVSGIIIGGKKAN